MTTLHMQSENVRDTARGLEYRAGELHYILSDLKSACARLSWAWQGSNSSRFRSDFTAWMRRLDDQIHLLDQMALRVNREADQWEFEDRDDKFTLTGINIFQALPVIGALPLWLLPQWRLLPPWFWRPPFWSWPPRMILPWPRFPWPFPFPPRFPWPVIPWNPVIPPWIDWWPVRPWPTPGWPWFPPIDWWKPVRPILPGIIALPLVPPIISNFFPPKNDGGVKPPAFQPKPTPTQPATPAEPAPSQPPASAVDLAGQMEQARQVQINQFSAELLVGDGRNANCGPTSLTIGLHSLGLKVPGEDGAANVGQVIDRARQSMVVDAGRDGVDASGARVESEHSTFTNFDEIKRGAEAAGAQANSIGADPESIRKSIEAGEKVVVAGDFTGKDPLPWTGDRGHDNAGAPGGAGKHIIAVTGYDKASGMFIVNDPARATPLAVAADKLAEFMRGNAGALALAKK